MTVDSVVEGIEMELTVGFVLSHLCLFGQGLEPSRFSVLWRGKRYRSPKDDDQILDLGEGCKVALFGSTVEELNSVLNPPEVRIKNDLPGAIEAPPPYLYIPKKKSLLLPGSNGYDGSKCYGFGALEVCEDLPNSSAAREILHSLASHPGVLHVMKTKGWFVPVLGELRPGTSLKKSDHAAHLLGLNEGGGQRILLLLRTDDGVGFRKRGSGYALDGNGVLDVLYHELSHIEEMGDNPHSASFYALEREVKREADSKAHFQGEGRRTGGEGIGVHGGWENTGGASPPKIGAYVLGGDRGATIVKTPAELAAAAALSRAGGGSK